MSEDRTRPLVPPTSPRQGEQAPRSAPAPSEHHVLGPGSEVDHFRILRPLGEGGMGQVFLAQDTRLGRKVALKLIHPSQLASPEAKERFFLEARATARFSHPHIVTVYAVGEHDGRPYLALEHLEGRSLREGLGEGELSLPEALRVARAIAEALAEGHRHGVLHRDLKPENVILAKDGRPRVVDFGLAKLVSRADGERSVSAEFAAVAPGGGLAEPTLSRFGELRGTPLYMAPEQWRGEPCTPATDLWAFGLVLCELALGRHPYGDFPLEELRRAIGEGHAPLPRPAGFERLGEELARLLDDCLDRDPHRRPRASEAVEILAAALTRESRGATTERNPYPGLLPFTARSAHLFYGREAETALVLERLREEPLLMLVGSSGAGKSSLAHAGVLPRLAEGGRTVVLALRPGASPFEALAAELLRGSGPASGEMELARSLAEAPGLLGLLLHDRTRREGRRLLLFVDHVEELYTLVEDAELRRRFVEALCLAADDAQEPVRVLLALREDFLGRVVEGAVARAALARVVVLRQPDAAALHEIVTRPLASVGYRFDDETLAEEMIRAVGGQPACLPLLQFLCHLLWERRDPRERVLRRAVYDEVGGVAGALATHADRIFSTLSAAQHETARELFLRLVTPEGTRRVLSLESALEGLGEGAREVLDHLVDARLLLARGGRVDGQPTELELVHESLVSGWRRLAQWRDEIRDDHAVFTDLAQVAELWIRRGRPEAELWRDEALAHANRVLARSTRPLPEDARRFVAAARALATRRRRRRRLLALAGALTLAAIAATATLVAIAMTRQEREAQTQRRLAEKRQASAQREAARAAWARGDLLAARGHLRAALETEDSTLGRALWWQLRQEPELWQLGGGTGLYDAAFLPGGAAKGVAVASQDRKVYLVDGATRALTPLEGLADQALSVAVAPNGARIAAGGWTGGLAIWDLRGGTRRILLAGAQSPVFGVAFHPDGRWLASGGWDQRVRLWDAATGRLVATLVGHTDRVMRLRYSPDGGLLASASYDGTVRVWDGRSGRALRVLRGHTDRVVALAFSSDGERLASGSWDETIRLWDLRREAAPPRVLLARQGAVLALAFHRDGRELLSGGWDHSVRRWNLADGRWHRLQVRHEGAVFAVAYSPDGLHLLSAGLDGQLHLARRQATVAAATRVQGHTKEVGAVAFHPDGKVLVSGGADGALRAWQVETGEVRLIATSGGGPVRSLAVRPDGRYLIYGAWDGSIHETELATGVDRRVYAGHRTAVESLALAPGGRSFASASWDTSIRLWDLLAERPPRVLAGHRDVVSGVAYSPDGTLLASASWDRTVRLWTLAQPDRAPRVLEGHTAAVSGVAFTPDGRSLVSGSDDGTLRLWRIKDGTSTILGRHAARVYAPVVDPAGRWVGAPSADQTARLWPLVPTGRPNVVLRGNRGDVNRLALSPDGALVATAGDDGTVRLFHAATGSPVWHASFLNPSPPFLLSHRGWTALDSHAHGTRPPESRWLAALQARARRAALHAASGTVCLADGTGVLELWNAGEDARRLRANVPGLHRLVALPDRCAALAGSSAWTCTPRRGCARLAEGATAIARDGDELLVAASGRLLRAGPSGLPRELARTAAPPTALLATRTTLYAGLSDGQLVRSPSRGTGPFTPLVLEGAPSRTIVQLAEGPRDTLVVGFANGVLGLFSLVDGGLLYATQLHGPVDQLLLRQGHLYAATELGSHLELDLRDLSLGHCDLLRDVWRAVPVVQEAGRPQLRAPPAHHPCRPASRD
ncbi:MAG: protein kinase [Deltaproteobacteria bacterium]|nr:protein kinase [Deltaproteobacteria bacterium]